MTHLPAPQTHSIAFYCPHCCEPVSPSLGASFHFPGTPLRKWFKVNLVHLLVESCTASLYCSATLFLTFVSPLLPLSTQREKQDEAVKVSSIHLHAQKTRQPIFYLQMWTLLNVSNSIFWPQLYFWTNCCSSGHWNRLWLRRNSEYDDQLHVKRQCWA